MDDWDLLLSEPDAELSPERCFGCGGSSGVRYWDTDGVPIRLSQWRRILQAEPEAQGDRVPLCEACKKRHQQDWDAAWNDYYPGAAQ